MGVSLAMTKDELLEALLGAAACVAVESAEEAHLWADQALLAYINDAEVTAYFTDIEKWYC